MNDFNQSILATAEVRELLGMFGRCGVRYLIIGGCAVMWYSGARYTRNIDIWTDRCIANASLVFDVLREYGAPLTGLSPDDFSQRGFFYQMGHPPLRIDDMLFLPGLSFDEAWKNQESMFIDGVRYSFISRRHLIETKIVAGRPQDIIDVRYLVDSIYSSKRLL
ncbi:MAG: hypothetical protein HGB02_08140 [Chlorobiaceae bacterium]|nr:hypothetical protein [Chlorobiaceae bacterium]